MCTIVATEKQLIENLEYANQNLKQQVLDLANQLNSKVNRNENKNITVKKDVADSVYQIFASFDKDFYLKKNPDLKKANINPYEHFIKYGFKEGREFAPTLSQDSLQAIFTSYNE